MKYFPAHRPILSTPISRNSARSRRWYWKRVSTWTALSALITAAAAQAATYNWTGAANNNWNNGSNWSPTGVPNPVADDIVNLSTVDWTAAKTLNLNNGSSNADRTLGTIIFGDLSGTTNWTVNGNGTTGSNPKLILAATSGTPTVQVDGGTTTLNALLAGTQGFAKTGSGTLLLTNTFNSITGGITLSAGTLAFNTGTLNNSAINVTATSGLTWNTAGDVTDLSGKVTLGNAATLSLNLSGGVTDNTIFASTIATSGGNGGGLIKGNAGILTITAVQTFTGGVRVNNGRVVLTGGHERLAVGALRFGNGTNSGVVQLGDATGASNQTVKLLQVIGTGTANAIVGGHTTNSILMIDNPAAITGTNAPFLGGTGTNENNLALVKAGAGSLTLSKANTFVGDVTISGGNLIVTANGGLGAGAKTVTISGTTNAPSLQLNQSTGIALPSSINFVTSNDDATNGSIVNTAGNNLIGGNITLADGGFGGTQTRIRVAANTLAINGSITASALAASDRTLILDGAGNGLAHGVISDNGAIKVGVTKEGTGTWTLDAANTYTGATVLNGGGLNLTTAQTGTGSLTAADGTTLGLTLAAPGQTLAPSSLTLGGTTGATISFDLGAFANPAGPLISTGALTLNGATGLSIAGTGLSVGVFTLIQYTGAIGGAGFASLPAGNLPSNVLPARVTANLVDDSANSRVLLNIGQFNVPKWTGAVNGDWDINDGPDPTTGTGTENWKEVSGGAVTRYLQFGSTVDSVLFDDSATGTTTINLTASLAPTSATISNSALNYTFTGAGKLTGATSLVKSGTGTLFLINTGGNDYTGTTTIYDGVLQIGDGATSGGGQLGSGSVVIGAAGSLVLNRPAGAGEDLALANVLSGAGDFVQNGGNTVTLSGNNATFDGDVIINSGALRVGSGNALGSTLGGVFVNSGGAIELAGQTLADSVQLNAGTLRTFSGTTNALGNWLVLNGGGTIETNANTTLTAGTAISGTGGLTKKGAGTLIISADPTYTGGTTISEGTLQLGVSSATTTGRLGTGPIVFNPASGTATLNILRADQSLDIADVISSSGAGTHAITIGVTGATSLSGTITFSGANTFTGNVTINGGALRITNNSALGVGPKLVRIGSNAGPALKLDGSAGNLTLAAEINFALSSDGSIASAAANKGSIVNVAGDNVINGTISLINGGGGNGRLFVEAGTLTVQGNIDADTATGARTLLLGGPANGAVLGVISDFNSTAATAVSVTKDGLGTWTLGGLNTFTGAVAVQNGTLKVGLVDALGSAQPLGTGSAAITLGTASTSGVIEYTGGSATLARPITVVANSVGSTVRNSGGGVLTLAGALTKNGTKLTLTGGEFVVTGVISGANTNSDLIVDGATTTLASASTYNGSTRIVGGGVVKNGVANALPAGSNVVLGEATGNTGGTYDLNGFDQAIAGLSDLGTGARVVTNSAATGTATLTVSGAGNSAFVGVIQDGARAAVALTNSGAGTFALDGVQTYTGATSVTAGTLLVGGSIAGSVATVSGTGTLGGTGVVGNVTVESSGALQGGDGVTPGGALSSAGSVTFNDGSVIKLTLDVSGAHSSLARTGAGLWSFDLDQAFSFNSGLTGGTYDNLITGLDGTEAGLASIGNWTVLNPEYLGSSFSYDGAGGVDLFLIVVPEPNAIASLLGGLGLLLGFHRHRSRRSFDRSR